MSIVPIAACAPPTSIILREKVIDTHYYPTKEEFRTAVTNFFGDIRQYRTELESLLTLNFHVA